MKKMGEMGRKRWLDDLYGKLLRLHLHYIWPRRKPYGLIARARGKSLPGPAHGLEPAAQQLRPLLDNKKLSFPYNASLSFYLSLVSVFAHLKDQLFGMHFITSKVATFDPETHSVSPIQRYR